MGLANFVAQVSGTAVASNLGGSASVGIYITLQWAPNFFDAGVYASAGPAIQGGNGGTSEQLGYITGNESNIVGQSSNFEADVPGGGMTLTYDDHDDSAGFMVGPAEEIGVAQSDQTTVAYGLSDLVEDLSGLLYDHFHPYNPNCNN